MVLEMVALVVDRDREVKDEEGGREYRFLLSEAYNHFHATLPIDKLTRESLKKKDLHVKVFNGHSPSIF